MPSKQTVVVIGNGMVGHRFCERLAALEERVQFDVVVFGEEPRAAYDRVRLSEYFAGKTAEDLSLVEDGWYERNGIELNLGERVTRIDREAQKIVTDQGRKLAYDIVVLCTGSSPFVPPIPGADKTGVFVYRTIQDLEAILLADLQDPGLDRDMGWDPESLRDEFRGD